MLQHGWTLKTCHVEEASNKRPHSVPFHLCRMSGMRKSIDTENRLVISKAIHAGGMGEG